jgi:hypothetical protein
MNQHSTSGPEHCDYERERRQLDDRGVCIRVKSFRQAENVFDEMDEWQAYPHSGRRDPAAPTQDARGRGCGGE